MRKYPAGIRGFQWRAAAAGLKPLAAARSILAWGPCAGKVNEILLGMTAKTEPLHERHNMPHIKQKLHYQRWE